MTNTKKTKAIVNQTPFVYVNEIPYLVTNFTLDPSDDPVDLLELVKDLLINYDTRNILILRPISPREKKILKSTLSNAEHEAWARIVVFDRDRTLGK